MRFFPVAIAAAILMIGCSKERASEKESSKAQSQSQKKLPEPSTASSALPFPSTEGKPHFEADGLSWHLLEEGSGQVGRKGQQITVHYTGWLPTGKKFDSSRDRNDPFSFQVGGKVIAGWNIMGEKMRKGDRVLVTIPPELGYGGRDLGVIPPNSTLIFDIQVLEIQ